MEYLYLDRCFEHPPSPRADPIDYQAVHIHMFIPVPIIKDRALLSISRLGLWSGTVALR